MSLNTCSLALNTFIASLRIRGLRKTVKLAVDEFLFDRRYGLDTSGFLAPHDMQAVSGAVEHAQPYMATAPTTFREIVADLDRELQTGIFVDFGCGKGRVVVQAAMAGFRHVIGVEFDGGLCAVAQRNLANLRRSSPTEVDAEIVHADVLDFEIPDAANVFYFYNPFTNHVMESVLARIRTSLEHRPRPHIVIYMNPVCHDMFVQAGFRLRSRHESSVGQMFYFYTIE